MSSTRTVTLVANAVTTITPPAGVFSAAGVFATSTSGDVRVTVNGVDPVANANDTFLVPAGTRRTIGLGTYSASTGEVSQTAPVVKLLSTGTPVVEVEFA